MDLLGSTSVEGDSESEGSELDPTEEPHSNPKPHDLTDYHENEAPPEGMGPLHLSSHNELTNQSAENENKENENLSKKDAMQAHQHVDICNENLLKSISQS